MVYFGVRKWKWWDNPPLMGSQRWEVMWEWGVHKIVLHLIMVVQELDLSKLFDLFCNIFYFLYLVRIGIDHKSSWSCKVTLYVIPFLNNYLWHFLCEYITYHNKNDFFLFCKSDRKMVDLIYFTTLISQIVVVPYAWANMVINRPLGVWVDG